MPARLAFAFALSLLIVIAPRRARADAEHDAYERARPVFEKHCVSCHSPGGAAADAEAIAHLDLSTYPFGGHHGDEAGDAIRDTLGVTGAAPSMPEDDPGAVRGDELELVLAWADAFDAAHPQPVRAQLGFATPRETLIPGRPGMAGMFHLMIDGFAHVESIGLPRDSAAHPLLTDDWAMGYGRSASGLVEGLVMLDFEPFTVGKAGYPELGQAGEGLYDAQHAHQLVHQAMVAVHPLRGDLDLSIFGGQGSATIGPPIFMHRASNPGPTVPRKHHKGENPHETFPVIGVALHAHALWLEASAFSGKELTPDDSRFYPHVAAPASFAARVRYDLWDLAEFQVSGERLRDQGNGEPDAWQASASATGQSEVREWRVDGLLDWALDHPDGGDASQGAVLELAMRDPTLREIVWTRGEFDQREEATGAISSPWLFGSLGFEHVFLVSPCMGLQLGAYAEVTAIDIPSSLASFYGRGHAVTFDGGLHVFGMWMLDSHLRAMGHAHGADAGTMPGMKM